MRSPWFALLGLTFLSSAAWAEEGMWLLNAFPEEKVAAAHGFSPEEEWLLEVQLSSARVGGCSASFVSPQGLVMTNHHCVRRCLQQLASSQEDLVEFGFLAEGREGERVCPGMEVHQLLSIREVTEDIRRASAGREGVAYTDAQKAEMSRLEKECAQEDQYRCDVVSLYQGGLYHLYQYQKYRDVRLAFTPEENAAFFGGDPDNFNFPRYALDVAFLRVYQQGKPAPTPHFYRFSKEGAAAGELVFVAGHPGSTQRQLTSSQWAFLRDVDFPETLLRLSELRGQLTEFSRRDPESRRISRGGLASLENRLKALKGRLRTLLNEGVFSAKERGEAALRARALTTPGVDAEVAEAWTQIANARAFFTLLYPAWSLLEGGDAFPTELFSIARALVRGVHEVTLPDGERLREFREAALPSLRHGLFSQAPLFPSLEELRLRFGLTWMREKLGADDARVRNLLGMESPETLAARVVAGTRLYEIEVRRALWEGGEAALRASDDPMIQLALKVDGEARRLRRLYEEKVEAPEKKATERIAAARFQVMGRDDWPDATSSLRLSYGVVKGWEEPQEGGAVVSIPPFTFLGGAYARDNGSDPFRLPRRWQEARERVTPETPLNLVATTDIIGGNSGSPMFNRRRELVGLVFDGNRDSLGGAFLYEPTRNRTVAVDSRGLLHALERVYQASSLVAELESARKSPREKRHKR